MRTRVIGTVCSFAQSDGRGSGNPLRWTILPIRPCLHCNQMMTFARSVGCVARNPTSCASAAAT